MAFCNSCGNAIEAGSKFCAKCGAPTAVSGATTGSLSPSSATPIPGKNSSINTVLIIVGIIFVLFVAGTIMAVLVARRMVMHTRVNRNGDSVHVETPFGTVESTTNADDVLRELGASVYPGARVDKSNASRADIAGTHMVSAQFTSNDSADKVAAYYKRTFPDANVSVVSGGQYTIVSTANEKIVTININPDGGKSQISITSVGGKRSGGSSSD